ncbi:MAG: hypothetical protein GX903_00625 [Spirochaetales bacterium]|nr:hypothetical protein [Spirochaetales bacterium]
MKNLILTALLVGLLLLVGCTTSVNVKYLQPSEIDMGQSRTIAIASTIPYTGRTGGASSVVFSNFTDSSWYFNSSYSDSYLKNKVAEYATNMLYNALDKTDYFNIYGTKTTDSILSGANAGYDVNAKFKEKGIKAVIIPKITGMGVNEYIYRKPYEKKVVDPVTKKETIVKDFYYYLHQEVNINFEYSIISVDYQQVITTKRFSKTITDEYKINQYVTSSDYELYNLFVSGLSSFKSDIVKQLVPVGKTTSLTLMENKPKDKSIEEAYKEAERGNLAIAKQMFLSHYQMTGFVPSGYNSALISAAIQDFDTAIAELTDLARVTSNPKIIDSLNRIKAYKASNEKAKSQISGTSEGFVVDGSSNIYSQVIGY